MGPVNIRDKSIPGENTGKDERYEIPVAILFQDSRWSREEERMAKKGILITLECKLASKVDDVVER